MTERTDLRESVVAVLRRCFGTTQQPNYQVADDILAIPEIRDALGLLDVSGPMQTAHRHLLIGQPDDAFRVVDTFLAEHFRPQPTP